MCSQIDDCNLIGGWRYADDAIMGVRMSDTCVEVAKLVTDLYVHVYMLLDVASCVSDVDATIADAGWKRCGKVRLHQNLARVRRHPCTVQRTRRLGWTCSASSLFGHSAYWLTKHRGR